MGKLLKEIKENLNKNFYLLVVGGIVYVLGVIIGLFLPSGEVSSNLFLDYVNEYFCKIMSIESSPLSFMLTRILNAFLIILLTCLLLSNKYTFYLVFVIILYRGFIIGYTFIYFVLSLGFNGIVTYLFLVLIQNIIITFAILLLMINTYGKIYSCNQNYIKILTAWASVSFAVCIIVAILEFLLIVCLFRPLNFYF